MKKFIIFLLLSSHALAEDKCIVPVKDARTTPPEFLAKILTEKGYTFETEFRHSISESLQKIHEEDLEADEAKELNNRFFLYSINKFQTSCSQHEVTTKDMTSLFRDKKTYNCGGMDISFGGIINNKPISILGKSITVADGLIKNKTDSYFKTEEEARNDLYVQLKAKIPNCADLHNKALGRAMATDTKNMDPKTGIIPNPKNQINDSNSLFKSIQSQQPTKIPSTGATAQ